MTRLCVIESGAWPRSVDIRSKTFTACSHRFVFPRQLIAMLMRMVLRKLDEGSAFVEGGVGWEGLVCGWIVRWFASPLFKGRHKAFNQVQIHKKKEESWISAATQSFVDSSLESYQAPGRRSPRLFETSGAQGRVPCRHIDETVRYRRPDTRNLTLDRDKGCREIQVTLVARKNLCQHTLNMRQTCVLYLISDSLRYGIAYVSPGACKKAGVQTACLQQHLDSIKAL